MEILKDFFKTRGYNVLALPKTEVKPFQLLLKDGNRLTSLENSTVETLFGADRAPLPALYHNRTVADLKGKTNVSLQVNAGFNALNGLLSTLGLGGISGASEFKDSDKIMFGFNDITEDGINGFLDLDHYISGAMPDADRFRTYKERLFGSDMFVITSVLKCNNFSIKIVDENAQNISGQLSVKDISNAAASLKREKDSSYTLAHKGDEQLVFAFKAVQLIYNKAGWFASFNKKQAGFTIKAHTGWTLMSEEQFPVIELDSELVW